MLLGLSSKGREHTSSLQQGSEAGWVMEGHRGEEQNHRIDVMKSPGSIKTTKGGA